MSNCSAQFPAELKLVCILDLIRDIRSGASKPITLATQSLWLAGCLLTSIGGGAPIVGVQSEATTLNLCDQIDAALKQVGELPSVQSIPAWLQDLILQLLLRLIKDAF